mmetsp:Transcript_17623/g.59088  ORF Transcript_17623/g.59088 Transcript_17623/m.59088 type:complete len:301 (-) Transcript_17623:202-1104(-)
MRGQRSRWHERRQHARGQPALTPCARTCACVVLESLVYRYVHARCGGQRQTCHRALTLTQPAHDQGSPGARALICKACTEPLSSSWSTAYTSWCRCTLLSCPNTAASTVTAKCVSPSARSSRAAWPACCAELSTISRSVGFNFSRSLLAICFPTGPRCASPASSPPSAASPSCPATGSSPALAGARFPRSLAFCFMRPSMLRRPLFRPGVSDAAIPASWMNFGSTASISSGVWPERPCTRSTTRPLVSIASESPWKNTLRPSPRVACTCTVERHPGTLFSGVLRAGARGLLCCARKSSCW